MFSHIVAWFYWLILQYVCSPWRRCRKIPRCCSETVCWDKPVQRTERRQRPDLSPSSHRLSRCSANLWGSWSSLSLSLPSSWTWSPFQPRVSRTGFPQHFSPVEFREKTTEVQPRVANITVPKKKGVKFGRFPRETELKVVSCYPAAAAGWLWIRALLHCVNTSVSSLSPTGMLEAHGGVVFAHLKGKSTKMTKLKANMGHLMFQVFHQL